MQHSRTHAEIISYLPVNENKTNDSHLQIETINAPASPSKKISITQIEDKTLIKKKKKLKIKGMKKKNQLWCWEIVRLRILTLFGMGFFGAAHE